MTSQEFYIPAHIIFPQNDPVEKRGKFTLGLHVVLDGVSNSKNDIAVFRIYEMRIKDDAPTGRGRSHHMYMVDYGELRTSLASVFNFPTQAEDTTKMITAFLRSRYETLRKVLFDDVENVSPALLKRTRLFNSKKMREQKVVSLKEYKLTDPVGQQSQTLKELSHVTELLKTDRKPIVLSKKILSYQ